MNAASSQERLSIGLCILDQYGKVLIVQRPQDDLLWQMPEFPVEAETDLSLAVDSAMELILPGIKFSRLGLHDKWLEQHIPDYIAKKEGLTGATSEQEKWFVLRLSDQNISSHINKTLYHAIQWVTPEHLITLIAPHKRLTYTTVLHVFNDYITADNKAGLKADFKSESQSFSKKTRQDTL